MKKKKIYFGDSFLDYNNEQVKGGFVDIDGEKYYRIKNYNLIPDFLMTIVSDSDHWNFISSNGSLSAGRKDRDNALFPYYTEDKIHDTVNTTGSKTILLITRELRNYLWEPFSKKFDSVYKYERNLYKNIYGNKIIFEEINEDLEISFRYCWNSSEKYGFVRKSEITNISNKTVNIDILDGIRNILPAGATYNFQNEYSNLLDGYKKSELQKDTSLGLFTLSSIPVDKAEPSESLFATTVWSKGLEKSKILISNQQIDRFRKGHSIRTETDIRANKGAYYISSSIKLKAGENKRWILVAEINQCTTDVANLNQFLKGSDDHIKLVDIDIDKGTENLKRIVASSDGLQIGNDELPTVRHFSNTLFNIMRGGIYLDNYNIEANDFKSFVKGTNIEVFNKHESILNELPKSFPKSFLTEILKKTYDVNMERISKEYLPLTFSRRHGDPSRPWNQFTIDNKNEDGSPKADFQGNWRDIFQNWEALSLSYPEFLENIISKFVNASTADGYNPYRIMRDGIDWECPDPDDPWAYIGYWGDHQIIYLQKLLELYNEYYPGKLNKLLTKEIFTYANVPYRIKSYDKIVENPKDTILFDHSLNNKIIDLVGEIGSDGRLVMNKRNKPYSVNLTEKILVSLLAKLSNFIPEAGIWLNTQRPEWNDANNALVGNGASMVTLYYLRRAINFWNSIFKDTPEKEIVISLEVAELLINTLNVFENHKSFLEKGFSNQERKNFIDEIGKTGSAYRDKIYESSFSENKTAISIGLLERFTKLVLEYIDQSIRVNKDENGLYHSYNLISFSKSGIRIRNLYKMLEGQVAVLSSGYLSSLESLNILDSLKASDLFRSDQYSYLLYPDRTLPRFVEKNNIPAIKIKKSKLLNKLISNNDKSIIKIDLQDNYHFHSSFRNAAVLRENLEKLDNNKYGKLVDEEMDLILEIYEEIFDHQSFTGRSGTFYAYEGLGSIYWHMVGKLLLANAECLFKAVDEKADPVIIGKLKDHFYEIKAGIGVYKSPKLYGAFPTDAYSHTPGNSGAKQPGMTGQVKEDIISRFGELGVRVNNGEIRFDVSLINNKEFLKNKKAFDYVKVDGSNDKIQLYPQQFAFTICQVPIIYSLAESEGINIVFNDNTNVNLEGLILNKQISEEVFGRTKRIKQINVKLINN